MRNGRCRVHGGLSTGPRALRDWRAAVGPTGSNAQRSLPGARRAEHRPAYEFIKRESSHAVEWLFLEREATIAMVAMSQ